MDKHSSLYLAAVIILFFSFEIRTFSKGQYVISFRSVLRCTLCPLYLCPKIPSRLSGKIEGNQRTSGPVNTHLISGPTVSTKTSFANFDIVLKWVKVNSGSLFI